MRQLKSMIYLSGGNLPTKWASANQTIKMAQAFSSALSGFELVTCGDLWFDYLRGAKPDFEEWYGLKRSFRITLLPSHLKLDRPFQQDFGSQRFNKWSVLYAFLKQPSLVYTRKVPILKLSLKVGLPVIWEWHERLPKSFLIDEVVSYPNFLGLVTTSQSLADYYIQKGVPEKSIIVESNSVDIERFSPVQHKATARDSLNLRLSVPLIVYAGHLYDYKGIPTILKVASIMRDCSFLLVGGWKDDVDRVREACQKEGLSNVHLAGHVSQSQLVSYLYAADILLLPTSGDWEQADITSPLKLFEYMASNRPIVASDLPNISEVISHGKNGLLAKPDSPESFVCQIQYLLNNPSEAALFAEESHRKVKNLTWEARASHVLRFAESRLCDYSNSKTISNGKLIRVAKYLLSFTSHKTY